MKLGIKHLFALLAAVLFALPQNAYSQDAGGEEVDYIQMQVDSILSLITPNTPDTTKARLYNDIGNISYNVDTVLRYSLLSLDLCKETDTKLLAFNCNYIGWAYYSQGKSRKALDYYFKSATYLKKLDKKERIGLNYTSIAKCYHDLNIKDSTFFYFDKGLSIFQEIQDTENIAFVYKSLGIVNCDFGFTDEAVKYYQKALYLDSISKDFYAVAVTYQYMGSAAQKDKDYNNAILYLKKSISIFDTIAVPDTYNNKYLPILYLASVYMEMAENDGNIQYADSCLAYMQKIGNAFLDIGEYDLHYSKLELYSQYLAFVGKHKEALEVLLDAKQYMGENGNDILSSEYYENLSKAYENVGDYKNALDCYKKKYEYEKNFSNDSTLNVIANFKTEQEMKIHKAESEAKQSRMRVIIFSLIVGLFLVSLLVFYIFRVLKIKKKSNAELSVKNNLLAEQKEEIEAQRDTIKAQSDEIQDSINYAQRIQRSLLTPDETIAHIFPDHFLLYKPRNVVSGDYYWVGQFGDNKVCIVADCTGHGVPGGFLSVLGMSNLNHIVGQDIRPDAILNHLRESIITNLRQENDEPTDPSDVAAILESLDRSRDGMDAAAYVVNEKQMKLSFAGANNPLILIRGNEMHVLKADRMPVGIYTRMAPFHCTTIDIQRGDCLYTFSDGFQDQFGYNSDRKFMSKRLRELLLEIHERPMAEQKEILNLTYEEWRGPASNQTDDVLIFGVRI